MTTRTNYKSKELNKRFIKTRSKRQREGKLKNIKI